ncbi:MAG: hypothetical protein M3022_01535 [Actinomycetota bacterium]|nr:hypothetical protein [Actinomycetota bacterium]
MRQATRSTGGPRPTGSRPATRTRRPRGPNYGRRRLLAILLVIAAAAVVGILVSGALGAGAGRPSGRASVTVGASGGSGSSNRSRGSGGGAVSPASTTRSTTTSATSAARPVSPFRVGLASLTVLEPSTAALANARTATGAPARSLPTVIRYPALGSAARGPAHGLTPAATGGPFPLVVFSQGFNYPAEGYAGLMQSLTRAGYVVADPTYPETDPSTPGGARESDIVNHPRDLGYLITQLLATAQRPSSRLHGLIDPNAIALAGQSDGGDVTLATAANTCCRDARIRAAVVLSGAEYASFGGTYYGSGSPPLLVTQGDGDTINVPGCSVGLYDRAPAPKYYLDLLGAPHLAPYTVPGVTRDHVSSTIIHFLGAYLHHRHGELAVMRRVGTVPGLMTLTSARSLGARGTVCPGAP